MDTARQPSAWVDIGEEPDRVVVRVCGELDFVSCPAIAAAIAAAIGSWAAVTVDLANVTFCGSQGIAMLVAARHLAAGHGTNLEIRGASPLVRRLLRITGEDRVVSLID